jgi:hypothetical protein
MHYTLYLYFSTFGVFVPYIIKNDYVNENINVLINTINLLISFHPTQKWFFSPIISDFCRSVFYIFNSIVYFGLSNHNWKSFLVLYHTTKKKDEKEIW